MNRQLYQMGGMGMESLSPMQPAMQPAMQSAMYNPLEENYYSGRPMMMAGGGIANLVPREKYGLGSALKSFARTFIPKELDPVLKIAAPFLGPVYGPIAAIAGSARTGKINPLTVAAATLPYVQFGGVEGATGLQSLMPTGYGGSGSLGQFLPGGDFQIGSGTNLASKLSEFMKVSPSDSITGKPSLLSGQDYDMLSGQGINTQGTTSSLGDLKTLFSPESNVGLATRGQAAMNLTGDALKAMYKNPDGSYDKKAIVATISAIPSYIDAKKKADQVGLSPNEFNEQIYNEQKQAFASRYASNAPASSFDIRTTAAGGGMMNDAEGILSIKLTPREGYAGGAGPIPLGLLFNPDGSYPGENISNPIQALPRPGQYETSGGGMGTLIKQLVLNNPNMFQQIQRQPRAVSENPVNDLYKYYLENGTDEDYKRRIMESVKPRFGVAMGGEIPVRQNQGGVSELDLRAKGGYIPVGIKEKADDVPAMLSKNEFVFTADAVRGAGNGSVNKGAQKMYKLMKSLEKKVKKTKVA
jgi:hypothetical protein